MDNLRLFLATRCRKRHAVSGRDAWDHLTRKLDALKEQDNNETSLNNDHGAVGTETVVVNCIKALHGASHDCHHPFAVLPAASKPNWDKAVMDLQLLNSKDLLNKYEFVKDFIDVEVTLPLELIWHLHKGGILQISTYVLRKVRPGNESLISSAILWLLAHSEESAEYLEVAMDTFASLLVASQAGHLNLDLSTICASILKKFTEDIVNWVVRPSLSCSGENPIDFKYLYSPQLWACGAEAMERYVLAHLLHLLNEDCVPNSTQSLMNAVSIQEKTTLDSVTPSFRNLLLSIIKGLGVHKVLNQLAAAVVRPAVSWRLTFLLIAALFSENPDCSGNLGKLVDELVQLGLEGGRQTELSAGFLLARQCSTCDSKNFGSYSTWFSSHFGPDSVTARNVVQFQSLLQLLTDIVPVESAEILRVHINKVPQAPTSCNTILNDYTVLARTRLADLNESSELAGLFAASKTDAFPGLDSRQGDIVKVLQYFHQTHEIMKPVIEASIFRRQYYRDIFLVELLRLPGCAAEAFNPEDFDLNSEVRYEFILALRSAGKVPDKLFKSYSALKSSQESLKCEVANNPSKITIETKYQPDLTKRQKSLRVKPKRL